jgi:hypothetical protein
VILQIEIEQANGLVSIQPILHAPKRSPDFAEITEHRQTIVDLGEYSS